MSMTSLPVAGVVGSPIHHSKSPLLFSHWLSQMGLRGSYVPLHVQDGDFETVIRTLPKMGFVGVNVTLPHKVNAIRIADRVTDRATLAGAANTLTFLRDGEILADNTDSYGFITNLKHGAPDWDAKKGIATVLGAGGAARAVIAALLHAGCPNILLSNRTKAKAQAFRTEFGSRVEVVDWLEAGSAIEAAYTLVNTTSLGMVGQPELRVPVDGLSAEQVVTDIVYTPLETNLLQEAKRAGAVTVDGLGMLLHQAVPGFERWFGQKPVVDEATRLAVLA